MEVDRHNEALCLSCHYYIQHYINTEGRFVLTNDGHCVGGLRPRRRQALAKKCETWKPREEQDTADPYPCSCPNRCKTKGSAATAADP